MMKTCTKCGEEKPLDEYYKHKRGKGGRTSKCKQCVSEQNARYYRENRETIIERAHEYRNDNRDRILEKQAKYYAANRDKILEQQAEYLARPEVAAARAEYRADYHSRPEVKTRREERYWEKRDEILEKKAAHRSRPEVKARAAEYYRKWAAANREHISEYRTTNAHIYWEDRYRRRAQKFGFEPVIESFTRAELVERWGDACVHCGGPFDELDHALVPVARGGSHTLENCRPSCARCNRSQGATVRTIRPQEGNV